MPAYYNEIDPYAAQWLRNLIAAGHIPDGEVDTRSVVDVAPDDLRCFVQCHFFAGLGGWGHALRLAGWPDDRPIWTGSCPCQPFSVAGKGFGADDPRHLWPHFFRLIRAVRPPVVMGEQVAGAAGYGWLDGVVSDLAGEGYAVRGVDIPACAVDAPHIRSRLYWVAVEHAKGERRGEGRPEHAVRGGRDAAAGAGRARDLADADRAQFRGRPGEDAGTPRAGEGEGAERQRVRDDGRDAGVDLDHADHSRLERHGGHEPCAAEGRGEPGGSPAASGLRNGTFWSDHVWLTGADGKARRAPGGPESRVRRVADGLPAGMDSVRSLAVPLLATGVPARVGKLRALGNAIVPQVAAEVIGAFMDTEVFPVKQDPTGATTW